MKTSYNVSLLHDFTHDMHVILENTDKEVDTFDALACVIFNCPYALEYLKGRGATLDEEDQEVIDTIFKNHLQYKGLQLDLIGIIFNSPKIKEAFITLRKDHKKLQHETRIHICTMKQTTSKIRRM